MGRKTIIACAALLTAMFAAGILYFPRQPGQGGAGAAAAQTPAETHPDGAGETVKLDDAQLKSIKVEPVAERVFSIEREAVGNIGFDEDRAAQVYPPYQGKIVGLFAKLGDDVAGGRKLYTIDSPDLVQAESTLISAAGARDLADRALERARKLYETQGIAQKELEQAISDQQAAEGAFRAARDAVRIFGKTDSEMDGIVAKRRIDPVMVVRSPITGRITVRNAAPGLLAQPGTPPAPYTVADISTMWMVAYVAESDSPLFHAGQPVSVRLMAFPGRVFEGKISVVGAAIDPNTHRLMVRSEVRDPSRELRPGMTASFTIRVGAPVRSVAVPVNGVVREGDGTMVVWVSTGRGTFAERPVSVGPQQDGYRRILSGLKPGELVATDGAIYLTNILENRSAGEE